MGGTRDHARVTESRARRVLDLAGIRRLSGLTPTKVIEALAVLRDTEGLSLETVNHHVRAVKGFNRWLWRDGRAREHVLAHLATSNSEPDRRRQRRALSADEANRLIEAAKRGPTVLGMTGPDRAVLYATALGTGFRRDELGSLTARSFRLDSDPPSVVCEAGYTKNGKLAEQPVSEALASLLRPFLATRPTDGPVFAVPRRAALMLRRDLEAAGIAVETDSGIIDVSDRTPLPSSFGATP